MRLIKPSVEILEQGPGLQGIYDMIELCGKTSYKSEVKGGEEAKKFVEARVNEGHLAVLEFGTVYLAIPITTHYSGDVCIYQNSPNYCRVTESSGFKFTDIFGDKVDCWCVTTNLRFIQENDLWNDVLEFLCEPTEFHVKRYCARFITDRGVSHELVRHRTFSFCQESTRYCNYSKDKFGSELTFIIPSWEDVDEHEASTFFTLVTFGAKLNEHGEKILPLYRALQASEICYLQLLENGFTPQQARQVLPNAVKTEICMCGFEDDWKHFFDLRYRGTTGKPHPDMLNVATMLYKEFEAKGISL